MLEECQVYSYLNFAEKVKVNQDSDKEELLPNFPIWNRSKAISYTCLRSRRNRKNTA